MSSLLRTAYNLVFTVGFCLAAPYYFWRMRRRGHWQAGFRQRFGRYDTKFKQSITNRHVLWIHAVSVGEVNLATQLIRALEPRLPNVKIVVSTTTTTGMGELHRKTPSHIGKIYYPIDRKRYVARALGAIKPVAVLLMEAEIWPNFLWRSQKLDIPVFLLNARLSERSYRWYRRLGWFFQPLFASFAGVGAQNESDAVRLQQLGCRPEVIRVVGSLKFDAAQLEERTVLDVPALLQQLGVDGNRRILLGGSTHAGEEEVLGRVFLRLRRRYPDLFLVVVPRHFERGREAGETLARLGLRLVYRSEVTSRTAHAPGQVDCLLVNTTGELRHFYPYGTVVFVGKSLTAEGGQNPLEPAAAGRPVVFGPHMENFAEISSKLVAGGGALQVRDAEELEKALDTLLADEALRTRMGKAAAEVVRQNLGAVERTVEMILEDLQRRRPDVLIARER